MPSFDVQWTRGVTVEQLTDPPLGNEKPSRLNPRQNIPPMHSVARPGTYVALTAMVVVGNDVVVGPPNEFYCRMLEWPSHSDNPPQLWSSRQGATQGFWAVLPGHYTVMMLRTIGGIGVGSPGGRVIAHLSVEAET